MNLAPEDISRMTPGRSIPDGSSPEDKSRMKYISPEYISHCPLPYCHITIKGPPELVRCSTDDCIACPRSHQPPNRVERLELWPMVALNLAAICTCKEPGHAFCFIVSSRTRAHTRAHGRTVRARATAPAHTHPHPRTRAHAPAHTNAQRAPAPAPAHTHTHTHTPSMSISACSIKVHAGSAGAFHANFRWSFSRSMPRTNFPG